MKKGIRYISSVAIAVSTFIMPGCQKNFLDINKDPKNPTDLPLSQILPSAEVAMGFSLSMNVGGINSAASTFVHQIVNSRVGEYVVDGNSFKSAWSDSGSPYGLYSGALEDLQTVINKAKAQNAPYFLGVAEIQKAYIFSILVDLFGDVPYSQALQGNGNLTPVFDKDSAIYDNLIVLLDDAITNLNAATSSLAPDGTNDFIYAGNRTKWIKLANSIKLKLYNQERLVKDVKAPINALIAGGNLISAESEDFQLKFGTSNAPENRNPGFVANYNSANQRESYVDPFFYSYLKNSSDPRLPYYIYNQLTSTTQSTPNPADFRDGRFLSVRFASQGPNKSFDQRLYQSLIGLFPVGGRYDNGTGGTGTLANGASDAPLRLLTFYNVKFILAEAALTVGTTGSPRQLLEDAMRAHFAKVNSYAATVQASIQTVPAIAQTAIDTYVNTILAAYDLGNDAKKLEIIMTQKWIAAFGYGIDPYTDYRRTGYPVTPDPATDGDPETVAQRTFPFRFPYPYSEINANPNAPTQPDPYSTKIFWSK